MDYKRMIQVAGWTAADVAARVGEHPAIIAARMDGQLPVTKEAELALQHVLKTEGIDVSGEDPRLLQILQNANMTLENYRATVAYWCRAATANLSPRPAR